MIRNKLFIPEKDTLQIVHMKDSEFNYQCPILSEYFGKKRISKREMEVMKYIVLGYTAKRIGQCLQISFRTVEAYIENLKTKLNCASKSDISEVVIKSGLIRCLGFF